MTAKTRDILLFLAERRKDELSKALAEVRREVPFPARAVVDLREKMADIVAAEEELKQL